MSRIGRIRLNLPGTGKPAFFFTAGPGFLFRGRLFIRFFFRYPFARCVLSVEAGRLPETLEHKQQQNGDQAAGRGRDSGGGQKTAEQGTVVPRQFIFTCGDADVPAGVGHPRDRDPARDAVIVLKIDHFL